MPLLALSHSILLSVTIFGLSNQMSFREIDSNQLMAQAAFRGIGSEATHNSSGSPGIDSDRFMTQKKKKRFIMRRLMNQLMSVIPMSHVSHTHVSSQCCVALWVLNTAFVLAISVKRTVISHYSGMRPLTLHLCSF